MGGFGGFLEVGNNFSLVLYGVKDFFWFFFF